MNKNLSSVPDSTIDRTIQMDPSHLTGKAFSETSVLSQVEGVDEVVVHLSFRKRLAGWWFRLTHRELRDANAEISGTAEHESALVSEAMPPEDKQVLTSAYDVGNTFARGGQSILRYAVDRRFGRSVVVKTLHPGEGMDLEDAKQAFLREAKVTAQLEHPAVIPVYSLIRDPEEGMHLGMRRVYGMTLQKYLHQLIQLYTENGISQFDERRNLFLRLDYFLRVCDAMEYAHARGVIHCDIKPENVMIGHYREVYVMDWGIARLAEDNTEWVAPKTIVGTLRYLAPEIINGQRPGYQSDIFSLGALLYELITLNNAFPGKTPQEIVKLEKTGRIGSYRHRFGGRVDKDLKAIVAKAVAPDPRNRYSSIRQMTVDVRRVLRNEEVSAKPDNLVEKFVRWCANHPRSIAAAFLAVFVAVFAVLSFSVDRAVGAAILSRDRDAVIAGAQTRCMLGAQTINVRFFRQAQLLDSLEEEFLMLSRSGEIPARKSPKVLHRKEMLNPKGAASATLQPAEAYGRSVDFQHMTYSTVTPGKPLTELQKQHLLVLDIMVPRMRQMLLRSGIGGRFMLGRSEQQAEQELRDHGASPHQIVFGFPDGLFAVYPGTDRIVPGFEPRNRAWYQHGMVLWNKQHTWLRPFRPFGNEGFQIACATPIYDTDGKYCGVVAMEMDLTMLSHLVAGMGNTGPYVKNKYLVDRSGMVCLKVGQDSGEIPYRRHRIEQEVLDMLQRRPYGYMIQKVGVRDYLWTFSSLETPRWIYVERIDLGEMLEHYTSGK